MSEAEPNGHARPAVARSQPAIAVIGGVQVDVVMTPVQELPPPGHSLHVQEMSFRAGGAAANAALAFARLGVPVRVLGCVGDDHLGRWLAEELAPAGAGVELHVLAGATGLTVACEAPARDRTFLTYLGVNARWERSMLPDDVTDADSLLLCDYFCAPALRGEPTRALLSAVRERGGRTFFDTAWDPAGFPAEARREVLALLAGVDVFLPNEAEARALAGLDEADADVAAVARTLQEASGGGWVVVKLGARGCLAVGPTGEELAVPAKAAKVSDSTGAGDAFNAGLIAALGEGRTWPQALEAAIALAARVLAAPGAAIQR